jgi:hypothetical protein
LHGVRIHEAGAAALAASDAADVKPFRGVTLASRVSPEAATDAGLRTFPALARARLPDARVIEQEGRDSMASSKSSSTRGRNQDRARVAGGQQHEVRYEAKKTGASAADVKRAVKSEGNSRRKVEKKLGK